MEDKPEDIINKLVEDLKRISGNSTKSENPGGEDLNTAAREGMVEALRPTSKLWFEVKEMFAEDWGQEVATALIVDVVKHHLLQQVDEAMWKNRTS